MAFNRYVSAGIGTTETTVLTATNTKTVIGLLLPNIYTADITVTVKLGTVELIKNAIIPVGSSLELIEAKLIINNGDTIKVTSSVASSVNCIVSVLE